MYTIRNWKRDRIFSAKPGDEVDFGVYSKMYHASPTKWIPYQLAVVNQVDCGFLVGGSSKRDKDRQPLYKAFGERNGRYYYLGLSREI